MTWGQEVCVSHSLPLSTPRHYQLLCGLHVLVTLKRPVSREGTGRPLLWFPSQELQFLSKI